MNQLVNESSSVIAICHQGSVFANIQDTTCRHILYRIMCLVPLRGLNSESFYYILFTLCRYRYSRDSYAYVFLPFLWGSTIPRTENYIPQYKYNPRKRGKEFSARFLFRGILFFDRDFLFFVLTTCYKEND